MRAPCTRDVQHAKLHAARDVPGCVVLPSLHCAFVPLLLSLAFARASCECVCVCLCACVCVCVCVAQEREEAEAAQRLAAERAAKTQALQDKLGY